VLQSPFTSPTAFFVRVATSSFSSITRTRTGNASLLRWSLTGSSAGESCLTLATFTSAGAHRYLPFSCAELGHTAKSCHDLTSSQYPLEMPPSYSEICRLVVFSHPDMCRCHQHIELRLWFKSKAYLPRTGRAGKKYWSSAGDQVAICL